MARAFSPPHRSARCRRRSGHSVDRRSANVRVSGRFIAAETAKATPRTTLIAAPFNRMNIGDPDTIVIETDTAAIETNSSDAIVGHRRRARRDSTSTSGTDDANDPHSHSRARRQKERRMAGARDRRRVSAIAGRRWEAQTVRFDDVRKVSPALEIYTKDTLLGGLWKRPGLSPRDRSLVTVAALIARNQTIEMPYHFNLALDNGVKPGDLSEIITHLAFYSGWANATSAVASIT